MMQNRSTRFSSTVHGESQFTSFIVASTRISNFQSREISLRLANTESEGYQAGYGSTYALLCLYALYCRPFLVKEFDWAYYMG